VMALRRKIEIALLPDDLIITLGRRRSLAR
jgi:hypothetical protein